MSQFIKNLEIKNFKSIKHLQLDCKRVNVLIGKPNVGKSNILEALSILGSNFSKSYFLSEFIRYKTISDIFYDKNYYNPITVNTDILNSTIYFNNRSQNSFTCLISENTDKQFIEKIIINDSVSPNAAMNAKGNIFYKEFNSDGTSGGDISTELETKFKKYFFENKPQTPYKPTGGQQFLTPPIGNNIFEVLRRIKPLRKLISITLKEYQLEFVYIDEKNEFVIQKNIDGEVTQFSYSSMADTFQRLFFYLAAIESNKNSTLILEEPEVHSFPPYVKLLAEKIAEDIDNQYFITTHSPYLLSTLLENLKDEDINIAITYFDDYETKIKVLSPEELSEVQDFGTDLFFNLDLFVKSDGKIHS